MSQRLSCIACGESIHPDTAAKNGGLCMPCKRGTRAQIEAGKLQREQERAYDQSAERMYWLGLVHRVYETPKGFNGLAEPERVYYAVSCLISEMYNGGFDQFFSNSSGSLYGHALTGLFEMEADASAALLTQAKEALFGAQSVPTAQGERLRLMPTLQNDSCPVSEQLEKLDEAFYADLDGLGERCKQKHAYEVEKRFIWWLPSLCEKHQTELVKIKIEERVCQERWNNERTALENSAQFLQRWLFVLKKIPSYGKRGNPSIVTMLTKRLKNLPSTK